MVDEEHTFSAVPKLITPLELVMGLIPSSVVSVEAFKAEPFLRSSSLSFESLELDVGPAAMNTLVDEFLGFR